MNNKVRGGKFERDICKILSLWWTGGKREDVFWRTGGSGGRAKRRGRDGKQTHGQHGDICATHPRADPFTQAFTCEVKLGYNKFSPFDVMDRPARAALQTFETWIVQAAESAVQAGSVGWLIISKRTRREAIVTLDDAVYTSLCRVTNKFEPISTARLFFWMEEGPVSLVTCRLDDFLATFSPRAVRALLTKG